MPPFRLCIIIYIYIIQTFFFLWVWSNHNHQVILSLYSAKQKNKNISQHLTLTILLYVHRSEVAYYSIRDGDGGTGRESEGSTADTAWKRPESVSVDHRQNNGNVKMVSPHGVQRLVHQAISVSTAMLGRVTRTISIALLLRNNPKRKKSHFHSPAPPPSSWSRLEPCGNDTHTRVCM